MEQTGKIIAALPIEQGVSKKDGKNWCKASYVLETDGQYPKKICFEVFGEDKIKNMGIVVGNVYKVSMDIESHEYNGRWYTKASGYKAELVNGNAAPIQPVQPQPAVSYQAAPTQAQQPVLTTQGDMLPF